MAVDVEEADDLLESGTVAYARPLGDSRWETLEHRHKSPSGSHRRRKKKLGYWLRVKDLASRR